MVFWDFPVDMTAHCVAWHVGTNSCLCLASSWHLWMIFAIISRPSCLVACVVGLMYICHFDIPPSVHRVPQFLLLVLRFFGHSACRAQKQQHRVCCAVVLSKLIYQLCVHVCVFTLFSHFLVDWLLPLEKHIIWTSVFKPYLFHLFYHSWGRTF